MSGVLKLNLIIHFCDERAFDDCDHSCSERILAIARNYRKECTVLAGLPLIVHSIRFARLCPEIERCIIGTDSEEIAKSSGGRGRSAFLRPMELAQDSTPMLSVLQHAIRQMESLEEKRYQFQTNF